MEGFKVELARPIMLEEIVAKIETSLGKAINVEPIKKLIENEKMWVEIDNGDMTACVYFDGNDFITNYFIFRDISDGYIIKVLVENVLNDKNYGVYSEKYYCPLATKKIKEILILANARTNANFITYDFTGLKVKKEEKAAKPVYDR